MNLHGNECKHELKSSPYLNARIPSPFVKEIQLLSCIHVNPNYMDALRSMHVSKLDLFVCI
jgi:hypothetical protein